MGASPLIKVIQGDITQLAVDAIVNAANSSLLGGGGVDGAIHRKGGNAILEECRVIRNKQGGCKTGQAVITTAGLLRAKKVIHTVGPVWREDNQEKLKQLLADCYTNSLQLAIANNLRTIAFPNISTGIYRFPKFLAADIAIQTVKTFLSNTYDIDQVIFVCYEMENFNIYKGKLNVGQS
ncbi:MAG: O-acetyl-ADP-ribose deacetylase [Flammeovirgaceae bacterium]